MLGVFEQAVLLAVIRLGEDAYGRAILAEVQQRLERRVSAGAIQATLARLEAKGLLQSRLGPGTEVRAGRPRRFYRLGAAGLRALEDAHAAVNSLWRGFKPRKGYA
jgi:PadR family transcriptional regulator